MRSFISRWGNSLGFWIYLAASIATLIKIALGPVGGHYDIFIQGTRDMLAGVTPYGRHINESGWWFYSPNCALFFFSFFAPLPDRLGQFLFMSISWCLFTESLRRISNTIPGLTALRRTWFWFLLTGEVIGGLLNTRIEMFMCGVFLAAWLLVRRKPTSSPWAGILTAMVTFWKFLTLPTVGLWCVVDLLVRRRLTYAFGLVGGLVFWGLLPYLLKPAAFVNLQYRSWISSLSEVFASADNPWRHYQHFYRFLEQLGIPLSYMQAQGLAAVFGLGLAAVVVTAWRRGVSTDRLWLLALGLGMAHLDVFAPTSQSAAYFTYAPLLLVSLLDWETLSARARGFAPWMLGSTYVAVSLVYSDLVPRAVRDWAWQYSVKSLGVLALAAWVSWLFSRRQAGEGSQRESAISRADKPATAVAHHQS